MASKFEDHGPKSTRRLDDPLHIVQDSISLEDAPITGNFLEELAHIAQNLAQMEHFLEFLPVKGKRPIGLNGHYLKGWDQKKFSIKECLSATGVTGIGVKTGLHLLCVDFDGHSAFRHAWFEEGINWRNSGSFEVCRDDDPSHKKLFFSPTPEQIKQLPNGEFKRKEKTGEGEQLEVFLGKSQMVIAGKHPDGGNYFWPKFPNCYPEKLSPPPAPVWNFVLKLARKEPRETSPKKTCNADWIAARPCPICSRDKDDDCRTNRAGDAVLCHRGNTFHPPTLALGEVLTGTKWAYCGSGEDCVGTFSKFKIHRPTSLQELNRQLAEKANARTS